MHRESLARGYNRVQRAGAIAKLVLRDGANRVPLMSISTEGTLDRELVEMRRLLETMSRDQIEIFYRFVVAIRDQRLQCPAEPLGQKADLVLTSLTQPE